MICLDEINAAIKQLEDREASFTTCAKLADLYAVRDQIMRKERPQGRSYSQSAGETDAQPQKIKSEFLRAAMGKPLGDVFAIMDELMETIQIVNPKVYERVMQKIENIAL